MKYVAALFFVLNGAAFIWMRAFPDDSDVSRALLDRSAADLTHDTTRQAAAWAVQVDAARGYQRLFDRYKRVTFWTGGLLLANAGVFFFAVTPARQANRSRSAEGTRE